MRSKSNKLVAGVGVNNADYPVVKFGNSLNGKKKQGLDLPVLQYVGSNAKSLLPQK